METANEKGGRYRLIDLFCGAGGCSEGYSRAGFEIVGVDIEPQPNYPFSFVCGDALEFVAKFGKSFDAIHASPPCQAYSKCVSMHKGKATERTHPELIEATREALNATGKPWVIENVPGAPLESPVLLCGCMFGLKVLRHRLFETNWFLMGQPHRKHQGKTPPKGVYSTATSGKNGFMSVAGKNFNAADARVAMGIDWMSRAELAQAIPPVYTEYVGRQLFDYLRGSL